MALQRSMRKSKTNLQSSASRKIQSHLCEPILEIDEFAKVNSDMIRTLSAHSGILSDSTEDSSKVKPIKNRSKFLKLLRKAKTILSKHSLTIKDYRQLPNSSSFNASKERIQHEVFNKFNSLLKQQGSSSFENIISQRKMWDPEYCKHFFDIQFTLYELEIPKMYEDYIGNQTILCSSLQKDHEDSGFHCNEGKLICQQSSVHNGLPEIGKSVITRQLFQSTDSEDFIQLI